MGDKYRSHIYGEGEKNTVWRFGGPPNYDVVNKLFEEGRTNVWPEGSLEERVQNIVKTWEMEIVHKVNAEDYKSVNAEKFTHSVNGRRPMSLQDVMKVGSYNAFLQTSLPESLRAYNPDKETSQSSNEAFVRTFTRGFALEIIEVYAGPPVISYKFRHWAFMEGPFQGHPPTGELVEFYGLGVVRLDESNRVESVEFFYDPSIVIAPLIGGSKAEASGTPNISAPGCPVFNKH
ncbi:pathogen-related protein-like [Aristolochia californica]|uniref:pathogen-related protein-like n=1 Tax=Aristolochia californica TaxID=171875 RepID=UPI0035D7A834